MYVNLSFEDAHQLLDEMLQRSGKISSTPSIRVNRVSVCMNGCKRTIRWESTSGSASGCDRFSKYMDKCSEGQNFLTVDKHGEVKLQSLTSLESLAFADWKFINPPKHLNHN
uniref:Uncharacterized protein n=1 Tax=Lactuca sativa TaxID=4236 RepID=A0A9R1VKD9_LACSA|nr:hypothetical protein LSAT_V11C500245810 [Lactuca sativa]